MKFKRKTPKTAARQEAHVFNYFTIMKKIAVTAAVTALMVAGTLRPANAQGAAAPAKNYKPGEYELYDSSAKAIGAQNFAKAITDLDAWKAKAPESDYAMERSVLYIQAYAGAKQFDKVLAEAAPLLARDLDKTFPDPAAGPGQVLQVLVHSAQAIQGIATPTPQQLETAQKAATMLKTYDRKPAGLADAQWTQAKDGLQKAADASLMYMAVAPGNSALQKGDCETAQNLLGRAVGAYPNNAFIAYQLGLSYMCTVKAIPARSDEVRP